MNADRLTGAGAGARKYDLLTAIGVAGLHDPARATTMLRLMTLVTARYNWRRDELTCGQPEMARLWGVSERTVKREMKRLVETGFLRCLRPGVRGRVASYRLQTGGIVAATAPLWPAVGTDYTERMEAQHPSSATIVRLDARRETISAGDQATGWPAVREGLRRSHPDLWDAWFCHLDWVGLSAGTAQLNCSRPFVARYVETHLTTLLAERLARSVGPVIRIEISVVGQGGI